MRSHRDQSILLFTTVGFAFLASFSGTARAEDPATDSTAAPPAEGSAPAVSSDQAAAPPAGELPPTTKTPPPPAPASGPVSVPQKWAPGVPIQQLPVGAYPEAMPDGGIFGKSFTLGPPTRGIWGGSLWLTYHGLQWPYMPETGIGVSGYAWVDTGYEEIHRPHDGTRTDRNFWLQQGRALLRVTPTYTSGLWFAQAQVELVGNGNQDASPPLDTTDDLWVRFGEWNRWDLQIGRYESWEVYHLGMGLDENTFERIGATDFGQYGDQAPLYLVRFSPETRESGVGYIGLHLYPTGFLRFELLSEVGNDSSGFNTLGERPAMIIDLGMIKLNFAAEYIKKRGRDNFNTSTTVNGVTTTVQMESQNTVFQRGLGGGIQFILDPHFEAGLNYAHGLQDQTTQDNTGSSDLPNTFDITSYGGFANLRIVGDWIVGGGADYTKKSDYNYLMTSAGNLTNGNFSQLQAFGAVQYVLFKRLFIKAVGGYAKESFEPGGQTITVVNHMYSGRIRFEYLF
jgi:hypothetical protein